MRKKMSIIIVVITIISTCFILLYERKIPEIRGIEDITIENKGTQLSLDDSNLKISEDYKYYQIYIYPSKFEIICTSKQENICNDLKKNKSLLSNYILSYSSQDLSKQNTGNKNIAILENQEKINTVLEEIFNILKKSNGNNIPEENIQQYFSYKSDEEGKEINNGEKRCLEQILMSVTPGSYGSEEIIKQRVESECRSYEHSGSVEVMINTPTNSYEQINFGIQLNEIKLVYKFFTQSDGKFEEKFSHEKIIPYQKKISKIMNIHY